MIVFVIKRKEKEDHWFDIVSLIFSWPWLQSGGYSFVCWPSRSEKSNSRQVLRQWSFQMLLGEVNNKLPNGNNLTWKNAPIKFQENLSVLMYVRNHLYLSRLRSNTVRTHMTFNHVSVCRFAFVRNLIVAVILSCNNNQCGNATELFMTSF